jgi:hypothetical protein
MNYRGGTTNMGDQYRTLSEKNKGWNRVWNVIAAKFGSYESWQYMGTVNDFHQFSGIPERAGQRVVLQTTVAPDDFDELPGVLEPRDAQPTSEPTFTPEPPPFDFDAYNSLPRK